VGVLPPVASVKYILRWPLPAFDATLDFSSGALRSEMSGKAGKTELEHFSELVEYVRYCTACGVNESEVTARLNSSLEINALQ
jgi:hypothetical protein